jgi:hypothetical protein
MGLGAAAYAPAPTFTDDSPPAYAPVGKAYSYTYIANAPAGEPNATFAVTSGRLPPGLSLNSSTGELSGTPTAAGVYTFTVQTENAVQATVGRTNTIATIPPTVTSISPHGGPTAGGTSVTIFGSGFVPGAVVWFGVTRSTTVNVVSATKIVATAPAASSDGVVKVRVATAGGSSTQSVPYGYGRPTVSSLSPHGGPTAGGTSVTIFGSGFVPGAVVWFGVTRSTTVNVVSATKIVATAPAASSDGVVNVRVVTAGGSSTQSDAETAYTYGAS